MSAENDDIDALVRALHASGWDRPTTTSALAQEDRAAAEALIGKTNARRLSRAPRGRTVRMVRTKEVYCVKNSAGWLIGAIEGKQNRPLYRGLDDAERDRVLRFARQRGFNVVMHDNPMRHQPDTRPAPSRHWWDQPEPETSPPSKPATPSARVKPSKRLDMLQQLGKYRA